MADIYNDTENKIVTGTASADTIHNNGANNVSISAGAGDDYITVEGGHNVTVSGGKGNDYVHREWGVGAAYVYTSGNDTIKGFDDNDATALVIADAWTSQRSDDSTVIINVSGKGTITLIDCREDNLKIVSSLKDVKHYNLMFNDGSRTFTGTSGDDYMWNEGNKVKVNGLAGDDYIETNDSQVTIDAGAGDDFVGSWRGSNNLIKLGAGNDIFQAGTGNYTVDGGTGNDTIRTWDEVPNISVNGGAGDDYFHNNAYEATIEGGDGNDFVGNWGSNAHHVMIDGGSGADTLENATSSDVTINGGKGDDHIENYGGANVSIAGGDGNDTIGNWDGTKVTIAGGSGNDLVYLYSDANVYVYSGGNDTIEGFNALDALVLGSVEVTSSVRSNEDSTVTLNLSNKKTLTLTYCWTDNINIVETLEDVEDINVINNRESAVAVKGTTTNDYITNYEAPKVTITTGAGNDSIVNGGNNVTIAGGKGNDYVNDYGVGTAYVYSAGNDTLYYCDDLDSIVLGKVKVNSSVRSGSTITLNLSNDKTLTLENYRAEKINIIKTLADARSFNIIRNNEDATEVTGTAQDDFIENDGYEATITAGKGDDVIENYNSQVTMNAGAGDDFIYNSGASVSINAGDGSDTISPRNQNGKMTIRGGKGNDLIEDRFSPLSLFDGGAGKDTIKVMGTQATVNGSAGNDQIYLSSTSNVIKYKSSDGNDSIRGFNDSSTLSVVGKKYSTKSKGDNVIVTVDKGKITLEGAASLSAVNVDFSKLLTVTNKTSSPVKIDSDIKVVDASARTKAVKITGNAKANSIVGGAGADTLQGGKGSDTFIYKPNEGTDTIYDWEAGDLLQILNSDGGQGAFTNSSFKNSKLTLTIDGGGKVVFSNVSKSDAFNINGTSYSISGSKLK